MKKLTRKQQKALHLLFRHMAEDLNEKGLDQRKVLKETIAIPWTEHAIKEQMWRIIQIAMFGKQSTKDITTAEINQIVAVLNRELGEKFGVEVEFPCIEGFLEKLMKK